MRYAVLGAGAITVCALTAQGGDVYQVNTSVSSGGIDLVGGGYATDALKGPSAASWVAVTGTVTHAADLSAAHPFSIDLPTANAKLTLKDSGLLGTVPVRVTGPGSGTVYFDGDTLNVDETTDASLLSWKSVYLQIDNLTVSSKTGPAAWHCTNATLYVRHNTRIGYDGGTGTVAMTQNGLGRTNTSEEPGLGQRGTANIYLGDSSATGLGVSSGTLQIKGGTSSAWKVYLGSANVADPGDGSAGVPNLIQLDGGGLTTLYYYMRGSLPAKIAFNGGRLNSHGWGHFFNFSANSSGDLILEGLNGKPIDINFNKFAQFVTWGSGATGRLIFRGDSDVYLYGGDYNSGDTYAQQCLEGSQFKNRSDGQGIVWEQTGDLYFKPSYSYQAIQRCLIQSDDFLPHGPANGGVAVTTSAKLFTVDLMGTTQNCNSLFGGGLVTNTSPDTATLNIGENGNPCVFDVQICANSDIDVNKLGAGEITVKKPIPGTFNVQAGRVAVTNATGAVTFGALSMAEGTVVSVRGGVFVPPASFDLSASGTGDFELLDGGVLRVGGDADQTLDLSRVTCDLSGVIEKVGSGTLTLVGASSFRGALRVAAGTVAVAEGASMNTLAEIAVADGATLDLASGVALNTYALKVRGVDGVQDASYSGSAEGAQALAGLTGVGTVVVVASTALWTGAVDDDATKIGNWQGIRVTPDVTGGSFSPVFAAASDNGGSLDVAAGYAFNGLSFTSDISSFTFKALGADSTLGLGKGGVTLPDDTTTRTVTFDTPLVFAAGNQTWTVPTNATLNVNGPLVDASTSDAKVTVTGDGKVYFRSTNSTYTGSIVIDVDRAYAYGDEPFGPSNATDTAEVRVMQRKGERLTMSNTRVSKKVVLDFSKGSNQRQSIGYAANTTNIYYGPVVPAISSSVDAFSLPSSSTVVFAGGYGTPDKKFYINWLTEGMVVISNKPFYGTSWESGARKLRLHCPGNTYSSMVGWSDNQLETYNPYVPVPVSVDFHSDWAFDNPTSKTCIYGTWDLHGHPQRVGAFFANANATIQSFDGPATFYVNQNKWNGSYPYVNGKFPQTAYPVPPSSCAIKGEVSLYKTGPVEFGITNRAIAATGTVTVAEGPFTLWQGTTWLGATNVVVSGGTFRLTEKNQLSPDADYHLAAGELQLDEGATQKARYLWLDDAETPIKQGVWGALDNTSVPAAHRTARITGAGTLLVRGDGMGLTLILR